MTGGGKYEDLCAHVLKQAQAVAAFVIVFGGKHGSGFDCQCLSPELLRELPEVLRHMADQIEGEVKKDIDEATGGGHVEGS